MQLNNSFLTQVFRRFSLRTILILLFVVQVFAAVSLTGYLSFLNGQKAVDELAAHLQDEVSARIQQHLKAYLETPHLINQSHHNAIRLGLLDINDPVMLGKFFWHQLQVFDSVSTIYYGNQQGGIVVAGRQTDGTFNIEQTENFIAGDYYIYDTDEQGNRKALLTVADPFDARVRPWYKAAKDSERAVWSEVFVIYARENLGIAANLPLYNQNQQLIGVLTTQLVVSQIADFLNSLKIGRSGETFIIERSGLLVASSTDEKPFKIINSQTKETKRLTATESETPLIHYTAEYLKNRLTNFHKIQHSQQFEFEIEGKRQYLQVNPLYDQRGIDWLIIVAVPEEDFMERIHQNTRETIILSVTALFIAILIGLLISHWIIVPILNLTDSATKMATGQWDQPIPVQRADELGALAEAFNSMVKQLQDYFATLATKNTEIQQLNAELEKRVIDRTAALNAKVQELTHTRNELLQSEKMASLGRLVAGFAHEINTPIGVSIGAASNLHEIARTVTRMLEQDEVDEEELISALESVEEAAELTLSNLRRAVRLVSSFKRTAVDQSSETARLFEVRETIEDVNNSLYNKFKHSKIVIHVDCPKGLTLYGLPGALDQILTNLMMNSYIHGFENGKLAGEIYIKTYLIGQVLHIEYADTGKGMEEEIASKIFEPFFTTRRGQGGTGLGMYICYNLITSQLRGNISCQSKPQQGVRFIIDYPVQTSVPKAEDDNH